MIRGIHESTIPRYMYLFETESALRGANDVLLHFPEFIQSELAYGRRRSAGNPSTSLSASFARVLFASIAGVDAMRKS
jgi:hypothetical protein